MFFVAQTTLQFFRTHLLNADLIKTPWLGKSLTSAPEILTTKQNGHFSY